MGCRGLPPAAWRNRAEHPVLQHTTSRTVRALAGQIGGYARRLTGCAATLSDHPPTLLDVTDWVWAEASCVLQSGVPAGPMMGVA
jgi:hypothetical protein